MVETETRLTVFAAGVVTAFVAHNRVAAADLPELLVAVHGAFIAMKRPRAPQTTPVPLAARPTPAQIRQSITADALVSFIDNRPYKTLKRHLTAHGLGPSGYRQRYGLPADYPMVCSSYSARRAHIAREIQRGTMRAPLP